MSRLTNYQTDEPTAKRRNLLSSSPISSSSRMLLSVSYLRLTPLLSRTFKSSSQLYSAQLSSTSATPMKSSTPNDVLTFWFDELTPKDWFNKSDEVDSTINNRFGDLLKAASACELDGWRKDAESSLAEIIVLDQFSRNIYRDTPGAFANDSLALALAQEAIAKGFDKEFLSTPSKLSFLYMPFMHSESLAIHERALVLFDTPGLEFNLGFEKKHKVIIDRFGRYPHRNAILGRESTEEEIAFLKEPDSAF